MRLCDDKNKQTNKQTSMLLVVLTSVPVFTVVFVLTRKLLAFQWLV